MAEESADPDLMELWRQLSQAGHRRDVDGITAFYTRDGVWDMTPIGMGGWRGRAAIRGFMEDWLGSYEEWEREAEELLDLGNGVAFAVWLGEAVLSAAAVRSNCATRPCCCATTARSRESRPTRTSTRPVLPLNV